MTDEQVVHLGMRGRWPALRLEVAPLSSKHRTKVLAALCEELGKFPAIFPGPRLWVRYAISFTGN